MRINEKTLEKLRAMNVPEVNELLEFYNFVTEDQEYESYVARVVTLNKFNDDLIRYPVGINGTINPSGGDLGNDESSKDKLVDRTLKFLEKQPALLDGTREMRASLTKESLEDLKKDKRLKQSKDLAM